MSDIVNELRKAARGQATKDSRSRVFDWVGAAKRVVAEKPANVGAGLGLDWSFTGGTIYADGEPVLDEYTYLSSNWAIPEIDCDGDVEPCWVWQDTVEWDADTTWPPEALAILKGGE